MNKLPKIKKFYNFTLRNCSNDDKLKSKNDYNIFKEYGFWKKGKFYFKKKKSFSALKFKIKNLLFTENEKQERIIQYNSIIKLYNDIFKKNEQKIIKKKNSIPFLHEKFILEKNLQDISNLKTPKPKRNLKFHFINNSNSNIEQDIVRENQKLKRHDTINILNRLRNQYSFFSFQNSNKRNKENKLIKLFEKKSIEFQPNKSISRQRLNLIKSKSEKEMEIILRNSYENF